MGLCDSHRLSGVRLPLYVDMESRAPEWCPVVLLSLVVADCSSSVTSDMQSQLVNASQRFML